MSTIRISRYNNYFNRRVLRGTPTTIAQFENIQFNPNDGVDTSLVLNTSTMLGCDYLTEGSNSHWFIMDATRIREGQWKVTLHRDVLRDYYDDYKDSTIFIDKAIPKSASDITIFNKENNSYNQIKKSQTLLSNDSHPWIVGYLSKDSKDYTIDMNKSYPEIQSLEDYKFYKYINKTTYATGGRPYIRINTYGKMDSSNAKWSMLLGYLPNGTWNASGAPQTAVADLSNPQYRGSNYAQYTESGLETIRFNMKNAFTNYQDSIFSAVNQLINATDDYDAIASENNKIYRNLQDGKLYKFVTKTYTDNIVRKVDVNSFLYQKLDSICSDLSGWSFTPYDQYREVEITGPSVKEIASPENNYQLSASIPAVEIGFEVYEPTKYITIPANRTHTSDSQYDIFAIPYGQYQGADEDDALALAFNMIAQLSGSGALYDMQILPFKPKYLSSTPISAVGVPGYVFMCSRASDSFEINHTLTCATTVIGRKKQSECQFYRLSSPNWAGSYEFNVAKNMADITKFKVSYTLKPYTPYVRICPVFNQSGLYAGHNSDAMGLILSGDFSLAMINNAWATYELNNKNYEKMFDRDIQSLDLQQRVQRTELIANGIAGTVGAATGVGLMGGLYSGPAGVAAGAVAGAASAVGAVVDYNNQTKLMEDTRSATIDKFNWQLGNIKAVPNTLTKVGSYNIDNKYSFILEEYDATDAEKDILENLLEYEGYTIKKIATIDDYSSSGLNYLRGRFIKLDIEDDSHVANVINYEISRGVFI